MFPVFAGIAAPHKAATGGVVPPVTGLRMRRTSEPAPSSKRQARRTAGPQSFRRVTKIMASLGFRAQLAAVVGAAFSGTRLAIRKWQIRRLLACNMPRIGGAIGSQVWAGVPAWAPLGDLWPIGGTMPPAPTFGRPPVDYYVAFCRHVRMNDEAFAVAGWTPHGGGLRMSSGRLPQDSPLSDNFSPPFGLRLGHPCR